MSPQLPQALVAALVERFDSRTWERGEDYADTGRVRSLKIDGIDTSEITITGRVKGSTKAPYRALLRASLKGRNWSISTQCDCPVGFDCKHAAALVIEALAEAPSDDLDDDYEDEDTLPLLPAMKPSAKSPSNSALLPVEWQSWSRHFQPATPAPVNQLLYSPYAEFQGKVDIHYLLKPTHTSTEVTLIHVPTRADGRPGSGRAFYFGQLINPPPGMDIPAVDVQLARRLILDQAQFTTYQVYLNGPNAEALLQELLTTGRCHWKGHGKKHPPLCWGEPRQATATWKSDAHGRQQASLEFGGATLNLLWIKGQPWYVDEPLALCGPLQTGILPEDIALWLSSPPVHPAQSAAIARLLGENPRTASWPKPATVEITEIKGVKPKPHLRLYSATLKPQNYYYGWKKPEPQEHHFAELLLNYQGHLLPLPDDEKQELVHKDGQFYRITRNLSAERRICSEIYAYDLESSDGVIVEHQLGDHSGTYTMPSHEDWFSFVQHTVPALRKNGWEVQIDPSFGLRLVEPDEWYSDVSASGINWFETEVGILVEGQKINLLPVLEKLIQGSSAANLLSQMQALPENKALQVKLEDGRTVALPLKRAKAMLGILLELLNPDSLTKDGRLKLNRLRAAELASHADADWRWLGPTELKALSQRLRTFSGIQPVPVPAGLNASLRPYQQTGLDWLQFLREYELAGILADDMGLGKTVQTLAHLLVEKQSGRMDRPSLVIAPTSLMGNWRQEALKFTPELRVLVSHGIDRKQHFDKLKEFDLIVTSYPLLPRDQAVLLEHEFHYLILDEAQYIKNPKTIYAQTVCQLNARHRLCLTGTPMENHLGELWSLFHFLLPGFLGDEQRFNAIFRRPIEKGGDKDRRKVLADRVSPFLLRRRKEEVVKELPPKTEIIQPVELSGAQRDLYESIRLAMHQRVLAEIDKKGMSRSHIIILDALLKLRQVCCHPKLISLPSAQKVKESAKLELLADMLPEMIAEGRRILLFSQFTSMLEYIRDRVEKLKIDYVWLTGDTTDRETPVQRFQTGEVPLFLISLKAGGTGLNLTAADTVIHYDPWWNPAVENQATDRAHRIGQDKKVFVYKFITQGTVEEKIKDMQARKRELIEGLFDEKRSESLKLSSDDLEVLFSPLE